MTTVAPERGEPDRLDAARRVERATVPLPEGEIFRAILRGFESVPMPRPGAQHGPGKGAKVLSGRVGRCQPSQGSQARAERGDRARRGSRRVARAPRTRGPGRSRTARPARPGSRAPATDGYSEGRR